MNNNWTTKYLGAPWVLGATGPDTFDCWGLLLYVYREHFGVALPDFPCVNINTLPKVVRLINEGLKTEDWLECEEPFHGVAVAMSKNGHTFHHVGIYIDLDDGYVLHSAIGANVIAQPLNDLKRTGWARIKFYKYKDMK